MSDVQATNHLDEFASAIQAVDRAIAHAEGAGALPDGARMQWVKATDRAVGDVLHSFGADDA